jgi:ribosomal protein L27
MLIRSLKSSSSVLLLQRRWKTNLGGGSTQNGRDSAGRRLGVKKGNGAQVRVPEVIIRQRGFNYYPGENVLAIKL